jgi:hypothetical protein
MSTLNVSNISDGTTMVGTSYVVNGSAKAWSRVTYFGGTPSLGPSSLNFSSVVDTETGGWTVNFTNSMANTDYTVSGVVTNDRVGLLASDTSSAYTTTQKKMQIQDSRNATQYDWDSTITAHGELA